MGTHYLKPALTLEQQADLLIQRGMLGARDVMIARLATVSYYRLSAYWYTFRCEGSEQLRSGTHFDHVWERYVFDQRLRVLVIEAIERIEVAVRTKVAHLHAHAYGPFGYATMPRSLPGLNANDESDAWSHKAFLKEVRKCIHRSREAPFVKHFRERYRSESDLPIWMAMELLSFGTVARMYQGAGNQIRQPIAASFDLKISELASWLVMLNDVRNICAHHGRLWNRKLVKQPSLPDHNDWKTPVRVDTTTVFAALTTCSYLLMRISPDGKWQRRVRALVDDYPWSSTMQSARGWKMGLPKNWLECPIWAAASAHPLGPGLPVHALANRSRGTASMEPRRPNS